MKTTTLFVLLVASVVSVLAAPVPSSGKEASTIFCDPVTDHLPTDAAQATRRDGLGTEFDTDLCLLKKRTGVIGEGIDNCDM